MDRGSNRQNNPNLRLEVDTNFSLFIFVTARIKVLTHDPLTINPNSSFL